MNIEATLYELFAYTIPGGFYIGTFIYLGVVEYFIKTKVQDLGNFAITNILGFIIIAYIAGLVLDPLARLWYYRFFFKQEIYQEVIKKVNSLSKIQITSDPKDWSALLAFLRHQERNNVGRLDRFNATAIMLRNISCSLLLSGLITVILIIRYPFYVWNIFLCILLFCLSILAGREAVRFHRWSFQGIYEAIVAYALKTSDFVTEKKFQEEPQN